MSKERVCSFSTKEGVLSYDRRVWEEVEAFVTGLGLPELARPVNQVERTRGPALGQVGTTPIYGHDLDNYLIPI